MSRIGKLPIALPKGVEVKVEGGRIEVKGPKGTLARAIPPCVTISTDNGRIVVNREETEDRRAKAMHGLARALINNMVTGVTKGFEKKLEILGVGYRAAVEGTTLKMELGYSHSIYYPFPAGIDIKVEKNTQLSVAGVDNEVVGQTAAEIRAFRSPEPYKGKGVRYAGEQIKLKVGKKNA
jgi:large subunit ribosomal protein L6